uniref:Uncharacterized protein n=1 Tax=Rhizophora mucronata TaxID=61149 RepID=A0A2P2P5E2_RHIMU
MLSNHLTLNPSKSQIKKIPKRKKNNKKKELLDSNSFLFLLASFYFMDYAHEDQCQGIV